MISLYLFALKYWKIFKIFSFSVTNVRLWYNFQNLQKHKCLYYYMKQNWRQRYVSSLDMIKIRFQFNVTWFLSAALNEEIPLSQIGTRSEKASQACLVWLRGLGIGLWTKRFGSLSGHMPGLRPRFHSWARARGSQLRYLSHIGVPLPLFLPPFSSL